MDWLTASNGLLLRAGLYLLVFWPTVGYYVYQDAKKRGLPSAKMRGVGYGFLGILGLFIYMAQKTRSSSGSTE